MTVDPLTDYEQFRTGDLDLIREVSGRVLVSGQRVNAFGEVSSNARMNAVRLGGLTLTYISYESRIQMEAPTAGPTYFVAVPLSGRGEGLRGSHETCAASPDTGLAFFAEERGLIDLSEDYTMFFIGIQRAALEDRLQGLLGREIVGPLRLDFGMDLHSRGLRSWLDSVGFLRSELERGTPAEQHPLLSARIEDLVLTSLLCGQPHNYSELLLVATSPLGRVPSSAR